MILSGNELIANRLSRLALLYFCKNQSMKFYHFGILLLLVFVFSCKKFEQTSSEPLSKLALLDTLQRQTFMYYWDGIEPTSAAARERIHMDSVYGIHGPEIITTGATGFAILATLAGIERKYVARDKAVERLQHLADWLGKADRFHGAWPHWLKPDGKVYPFSEFDDGGDLVETAFLAQGFIAARQYFENGNRQEKKLAATFDELWQGIDWSWYTNGEEVLFWHWSPNHDWKMNFRVRGYNECMIMYILAASSPTHPVDAAVFHKGFMRDGDIVTNRKHLDLPTVFDHYDGNDDPVGPLFRAHYSFMALDPRNLKDAYADYWQMNQNHVKIVHKHCTLNPHGYKGYSEKCWGLTSSYSMLGYAGHQPNFDLGVISPTAALSSMPYLPEEAKNFMEHLYKDKPHLIGRYGPYDAFSDESDWYVPHYLGIDQLPISVMVENHRSGLLWKLFMSAPEVQDGLKKLDFSEM